MSSSRGSAAKSTAARHRRNTKATDAQASAVRTRQHPAKTNSGVAADDPWAAFRIEAVGAVFNRASVAKFIGVSASQPTRWATGEERPGPDAAHALIDLDYIVARTRLIWGAEAAGIWLESPNAFLSGARPLDVLKADGAAPILEALDAEMWGGAA